MIVASGLAGTIKPFGWRKTKARYQRESVACLRDCTRSLPDGSADSIVFITILPFSFRQKLLTAYPRQPATSGSVRICDRQSSIRKKILFQRFEVHLSNVVDNGIGDATVLL